MEEPKTSTDQLIKPSDPQLKRYSLDAEGFEMLMQEGPLKVYSPWLISKCGLVRQHEAFDSGGDRI